MGPISPSFMPRKAAATHTSVALLCVHCLYCFLFFPSLAHHHLHCNDPPHLPAGLARASHLVVMLIHAALIPLVVIFIHFSAWVAYKGSHFLALGLELSIVVVTWAGLSPFCAHIYGCSTAGYSWGTGITASRIAGISLGECASTEGGTQNLMLGQSH